MTVTYKSELSGSCVTLMKCVQKRQEVTKCLKEVKSIL